MTVSAMQSNAVIATIHDAIACLEKDIPFVIEIMEQELEALGITLAPGKLVGKPM